MTWGDLYVVVTLAAYVGTVIVAGAWLVDRWPEIRAAHRERRRAYLDWLRTQGEDGSR